MKANEVMIGDWVEPDQCMVPTTYTRVAMIMPNGVYMEESERQFDFEELHPIHVTKEILEANGFKRTGPKIFQMEYYEAKEKRGERIIELYLHGTEDNCIIHIERPNLDGFWLHSPCCVHQLQQALRLMGFSDMADNFKIKKGANP